MSQQVKKANMTDPSGSIIGALVGLAGTLGLLTRWDISADQAAQALGFAFMIAAAARAWMTGRQSGQGERSSPGQS